MIEVNGKTSQSRGLTQGPTDIPVPLAACSVPARGNLTPLASCGLDHGLKRRFCSRVWCRVGNSRCHAALSPIPELGPDLKSSRARSASTGRWNRPDRSYSDCRLRCRPIPQLSEITTLLDNSGAAATRLQAMLTSLHLRSGVIALALLVVLVGFASLRTRRFVRYEFWRATHGSLAVVTGGLTLHHALNAGTYTADASLAPSGWSMPVWRSRQHS